MLHNPSGQKQQMSSLQTVWESGFAISTALCNQASNSGARYICTNTDSQSASSTTKATPGAENKKMRARSMQLETQEQETGVRDK